MHVAYTGWILSYGNYIVNFLFRFLTTKSCHFFSHQQSPAGVCSGFSIMFFSCSLNEAAQYF
jgi:hypothetical protein